MTMEPIADAAKPAPSSPSAPAGKAPASKG
jgi:hypothetical protein